MSERLKASDFEDPEIRKRVRIWKLGRLLSTGGYSIFGDSETENRLLRESLDLDEGQDESRHLTLKTIKEEFGYVLVENFPSFDTNRTGVSDFHKSLEHFAHKHGEDQVIGSLFLADQGVRLGVFLHSNVFPERSSDDT